MEMLPLTLTVPLHRGGGIAISGSTDRYQIKEADWTTSLQRNQCGDISRKLKIRLEVTDSDYAFKGTYRSSNVTVKGAEFVSKQQEQRDLVIKAVETWIKGTFEALGGCVLGRTMPREPQRGRTDNLSETGQYEVELRKGSFQDPHGRDYWQNI